MQPKDPSDPGRRKFLIASTSVVGTVGVAGAEETTLPIIIKFI